jgi:plastocyanin
MESRISGRGAERVILERWHRRLVWVSCDPRVTIRRRPRARRCLLSLAMAGAVGCSSSPSSTNPSGSSTAVITITGIGASPKSVTVPPGGRVTFANHDTKAHQMYSDPHPEHTDCPEFDQVGFLAPGESRTTGNLNTVRTCGFHDHGDFENASLRGSVVIQ